MIKGKKYKVHWKDIHTNNDWLTLPRIIEEVQKLKTITSTWIYIGSIEGWFIFSSGASKDLEPEYFDWVAVPKGAVDKAVLIK